MTVLSCHPVFLARLRASRVSWRSAANRRSNQRSTGSAAAAALRRAFACDSFCLVVPRAAAMSSHEAPSRRAASIQKISALEVAQRACRRLSNALRGLWGPRMVRRRASDALSANWRANVPSGVLTVPQSGLPAASREVDKKSHIERLPAVQGSVSSAFDRRAAGDTFLISSYISRHGAFTDQKNDPHAIAVAGGLTNIRSN